MYKEQWHTRETSGRTNETWLQQAIGKDLLICKKCSNRN